MTQIFSKKRASLAMLAMMVVSSLSFAPSAPVYAKDGNNASLIGGLAAGALVGGVVGNALGKQEQQQQPQPVYVAPPPPPPPTVVERRVIVERPVEERIVEEKPAPQCHVVHGDLFDMRDNFIGRGTYRVCP